MWRSYYDKRHLKLFSQLTELLRSQYHLPYLRSHLIAYHATKAAFIFKEGNSSRDYERALPDLLEFYLGIQNASEVPFDVQRAAALELDWWIVHREKGCHSSSELEAALARLAAEIYHLPAERFLEYGKWRAEAMRLRDKNAEAGSVTEEDWSRIYDLLKASWKSLRFAVNTP